MTPPTLAAPDRSSAATTSAVYPGGSSVCESTRMTTSPVDAASATLSPTGMSVRGFSTTRTRGSRRRETRRDVGGAVGGRRDRDDDLLGALVLLPEDRVYRRRQPQRLVEDGHEVGHARGGQHGMPSSTGEGRTPQGTGTVCSPR